MRRLEQEGGAVAVTVVVLLAVLLGAAALVLDGGNLYWERHQLQNAADAAALAVAVDCAAGNCGDYGTTATDYALANDRRGANVEEILPADLAPASGEVTVVTRTGDDAGGPSVIQNWLIPILGGGNDTSTVRATATATWGAAGLPASLTIPITLSTCDFMEAPEGGNFTPADMDAKAATLPSVDDLPTDAAGNVTGGVYVTLHDAAGEDACTVAPGFSGEDESSMPGGFGWLALDSPASECRVRITAYEESGEFWVPAITGNYPQGRDCVEERIQIDTIVPIFTGFRPSPPRAYRLYAPAAFFITGHRLPGATAPPGFSCPGGGSQWCVQGHFVRKTDSTLPSEGGADLGVMVIELSN